MPEGANNVNNRFVCVCQQVFFFVFRFSFCPSKIRVSESNLKVLINGSNVSLKETGSYFFSHFRKKSTIRTRIISCTVKPEVRGNFEEDVVINLTNTKVNV